MTRVSAPALSMRRVEHLLGRERASLRSLAGEVNRHYAPFHRRRQRGTGNWRHVDNPDADLKDLQREIGRRILSPVPLPPRMLGISHGSTRDHAGVHVGKSVVVILDLRECFFSTKDRRVFQIFTDRVGCAPAVAALLTRLVTVNCALPEGAPTSPKLAALALVPLYEELEELAREMELDFSMYVDDIALSGRRAELAIGRALQVLHRHGYRARACKIRVMRANASQRVTGLPVNQKLSVDRDRLRAIRQCIAEVGTDSDIPDRVIRSIRGQIEYVRSVSPAQARALDHLADRFLPAVGIGGPRQHTDEVQPCRCLRGRRLGPATVMQGAGSRGLSGRGDAPYGRWSRDERSGADT